MKSTEMIFLDNESLWEKIVKYAAAQSLLDHTHDHMETDEELAEAKAEFDKEEAELRLMLGLPNEKPVLEESGDRQDGELWTNWTRTYWRDSAFLVPYQQNEKTVYPSKEMAIREAVDSAKRLGSVRHKISHDYDIDENLNVVLIDWQTKKED